MKPRQSLAAVLALLLAGCTTWQRKGDALFYEWEPTRKVSYFSGPPAHRLKLPPIEIGKRGQTVIHVRDLPAPILPDWAQLKVREEERYAWEYGQPWRSAVFVVTFTTPEGALLHSQRVALADWQGGASAGSTFTAPSISIKISPWSSLFPEKEYPKVSGYDMIVDVQEPSARRSDRLTMEQYWPLRRRPAPTEGNQEMRSEF